MDNVYFLLEDSMDACTCCIVCRDTDLRIRVLKIGKCHFEPDKNEIQMYAYHKHQLLAFETVAIQAEDAMDMIEAISWYGRHILHNENLEILPYNPLDEMRDIAM